MLTRDIEKVQDEHAKGSKYVHNISLICKQKKPKMTLKIYKYLSTHCYTHKFTKNTDSVHIFKRKVG